MKASRALARSAVVGATVVTMVGAVGASPAGAAWDGCFQGQLGLYRQAGGEGDCLGFSGTNRTFGPWNLSDDVRSGKNEGRSGNRARVYPHTDGTGGIAMCIAQFNRMNNPSSPQGNSNDWGNACNGFTNYWGVYVK